MDFGQNLKNDVWTTSRKDTPCQFLTSYIFSIMQVLIGKHVMWPVWFSKSQIKNMWLIISQVKWYHDPFGITSSFQLRLELSPPKHHKKCHYFVDTPSAMYECEPGIEDTIHYLFHCSKFFRQRISVAATVVPILITHDLAPSKK